MCGLAGYYAQDGLPQPEGAALLDRMLAAIDHRGPDDRGRVIHERCGLGSTRLAIVDVEGGHLPMEDPEAGLTLAYNGEIYDHQDHRRAVEGSGYRFTTTSDAEVLLPLYRAHGVEAPAQVAGMFAFALWDAPRSRLLLARDRFGIKPLFMARSDDGRLLLFASEIKALLASGLVKARLDPRALQDVLSAGYPMPPRTAFAGVEAMLPGQRLVIEGDGEPRAERYHRVPYPGLGAPAPRGGLADAAEAFRARFDQVVRDHLMADVPVASYLSGGIDSVSVAARAAQHAAGLNTFSMVFGASDARYDESRHSDLAAKHLDVAHRRVELTEISRDDFVGTIRAMEAPQIHTVPFCLYQLARAVRQAGLKVVLSGEGADEVLAGYRAFRIARFRRALSGRWMFLRRGLVKLFVRRRQPALAEGLLRWWAEEPDVQRRYGLVPPWVEQWWLMSEAARPLLVGELGEGEGIGPLPAAPPDVDLGLRSALHRDLAFEQASRLDGWVLAMGDRLSMAHSVELRVPFLDHRLVSDLAGLPPQFLLRRTKEKLILRRAMQADLPPHLARRKKHAFVAPTTEWLFGEATPEWVQDTLSPANVAASGLFDPAAVAAAQDRVRSAQGMEAMTLGWALTAVLSTLVWKQVFDA